MPGFALIYTSAMIAGIPALVILITVVLFRDRK